MKIPLFDCHCDTISALLNQAPGETLRENHLHVDLVRGSAYTPWVQVFALFAVGQGAEDKHRMMRERFLLEMERNRDSICHCRNAREARSAFESGKSAAFVSLEGTEQIGCSIRGLENAAAFGVKSVNLTWNHANIFSGTNAEDSERGLSAEGISFVRRCEDLGILPDVSHISDAGFWDVIRYTRGPVIASHSNLRSLCGHPRNLTDDMFRALCDHGGVVGINYYPVFLGENPDLDTIVRHVERFLELGGEHHLGIGGDLDGIDHMPQGIDGIQDTGKLYLRLQELGYGEKLLHNLFFENFMRVFA